MGVLFAVINCLKFLKIVTLIRGCQLFSNLLVMITELVLLFVTKNHEKTFANFYNDCCSDVSFRDDKLYFNAYGTIWGEGNKVGERENNCEKCQKIQHSNGRQL